MDEETRLLDEARRGSREAFGLLVRLHQIHVRAYLGRFVDDDNTVDDLAQETFLSALRHLDRFRGESALRTWLLSIARNHALLHLQQKSSRTQGGVPRVLLEWATERLEGDSPETSERRTVLDALDNCLSKLPSPHHRLVEQFYYKGRSATEIARTEGRKESAVWMALLRVRQALRQCMQGRINPQEAL